MTEDEIRLITIKATTEGVDQAVSDLNKITTAQGDLSVVSDTTTKATTSVQNALNKYQMTLDGNYRAQNQFNTAQLAITRGFNEGLIPLGRFNDLSALNAARFAAMSAAGNVWEKDAGKIGEVMGVVEARAVGMASNFGIMGAALTVLGPVGIAVGAVLGIVAVGIYEAKQAADALSASALGLRQFSETTGISTLNLQALTNAAADLGVSSDRVKSFVERFTVSLDGLRNGSGTLFTALTKIDPELVRQMAAAKDTTTAFDILSTAYQNATSAAQKNALARAAGGGKGGGSADVGLILGDVATKGGLDALAQGMTTFGILTSEQINRWTDMDAQINATMKRAKDGMAAIFTDDVKEAELAFARGMEQIAIEAERVSKLTPAQAWTEWFINMGKYLAVEGGGVSQEFNAPKPQPNIIPTPAYPPQLNTVGLEGPAPAITQNNAIELAYLKDKITALGTVASADDKLREKELSLAAAYDAGKLGLVGSAAAMDLLSRARAGAELESQIQTEAKRISMLGEAVPLTELLTQKENEINLVRLQGITITSDEEKGILAAAAAAKQSAITSILTANDVVTAEQLRATKLAELHALQLQGILDQDQVNVKALAYEKIIEQTMQQQQILISTLPGLMQLELTSGTLRTQLDTLGTSITNGVSTPLVAMIDGTQKASDAFKLMAQNIVTAITQMVVNMSIAMPIARALQGVLGAFLPSGGGLAAAMAGNAGSIPNPNAWTGLTSVSVGHTGGIVGNLTASRYIHPAYFDDAPRFHSGGLVSGEVPIIAKQGEGVFTPEQMAAMGGKSTTQVNIYNYANNTTVQQNKRTQSGGADIVNVIVKTVNDAMASGSFDKTQRARFNNSLTARQR